MILKVEHSFFHLLLCELSLSLMIILLKTFSKYLELPASLYLGIYPLGPLLPPLLPLTSPLPECS